MDLKSRECLSLIAEASVMLCYVTLRCSNDITGDNSAMQSQA